jgi:hypothetical protein
MSAFIQNLNVPVNDCTMRLSIRWKTTFEISRMAQDSAQLNVAIHGMLKDIFSDEDGLLYRWEDEGLETSILFRR